MDNGNYEYMYRKTHDNIEEVEWEDLNLRQRIIEALDKLDLFGESIDE